MSFIIDTAGDKELQSKIQLFEEDEKPLFVDCNDKADAILLLLNKKKEELDEQTLIEEASQEKLKTTKVDAEFKQFFADMEWTANLLMKTKNKNRLFNFDQLDKETGKLMSNLGAVDVAKEMEKSVIQPGFEKQHVLPSYHTSARKLKAEKKKEKEKTKGPEWFNLPAPEVTEEMHNDLQILKMRSALDPKRFYKKNDMEALPKYFQVGKVMDTPLDHMNQRLTKAQRKRTMVDELLADADIQKYNKKKYKEIIDNTRKSVYKTFMKTTRQINKAEIKKNKMAENPGLPRNFRQFRSDRIQSQIIKDALTSMRRMVNRADQNLLLLETKYANQCLMESNEAKLNRAWASGNARAPISLPRTGSIIDQNPLLCDLMFNMDVLGQWNGRANGRLNADIQQHLVTQSQLADPDVPIRGPRRIELADNPLLSKLMFNIDVTQGNQRANEEE